MLTMPLTADGKGRHFQPVHCGPVKHIADARFALRSAFAQKGLTAVTGVRRGKRSGRVLTPEMEQQILDGTLKTGPSARKWRVRTAAGRDQRSGSKLGCGPLALRHERREAISGRDTSNTVGAG